jgi:uncharacterized protein (DUF885 family)
MVEETIVGHMQRVCPTLIITTIWILSFSGKPADTAFVRYKAEFIRGYLQLHIPEVEYDYRNYFTSIPSEIALEQQEQFFREQSSRLNRIDQSKLSTTETTEYEHLLYELSFNLYRIELEKNWVKEGRNIPEGGLSQMKDHRNWYRYFIKKFTSTEISPEEVFALGEKEVARVTNEIETIRKELGFPDHQSFYEHLHHDSFFITDKRYILEGFERIDSLVRTNLNGFIGSLPVAPVYAMEWPGADANTPPGIYLNRTNTAYGKDVFQFNFSAGRYNKRAMEWLYMHEAIPGHHLQSTISRRTELQQLFLYPGNFEGWGCYVEYLGKKLGLYQDPYSYLGKWEWDLVRSARLVIDAGIHYHGWTRQQALNYWKTTIPGQDEIAEREVTRVTNWCGQALSYKVGADYIVNLKKEWVEQHKGRSTQQFHIDYLQSGVLPLTVLKKHLLS